MTVRPALLAGLLLAAASCSPPPVRPDIVLVSLDTTRADHLSAYGYERETTPCLDAMAEEGLLFEHAVPTATWTLPSHASMFTGLDPAEHGCYTHTDESAETGGFRPALSADLPVFTDRLADAGYFTVGVVGNTFTSRDFGFGRGYDRYVDEHTQASASVLNERLWPAVDDRPEDRPLFLFVNYVDAHAPYDPPGGEPYPFGDPAAELERVSIDDVNESPHREFSDAFVRNAVEQYDRELWLQDRALGELFDGFEQRGWNEDSLWIVTSDHGELLGEGGIFGHGFPPYEEVARVPLVIYREVGGVPALSGRVPEPVSLANIPDTVLAHAGLPRLPHPAGRFDLTAMPADPPAVFVEHRGVGTWVGVLLDGDLRYGQVFEAPAFESSEFVMIPAEIPPERVVPVDGRSEPVLEQAREQMSSLVDGWIRPPDDLSVPELGQSELEDLRAFGYVGD